MTYREIKQFTEIVRTLGYPHPVGIDSFDTPNFGLMADLLHWLATLYDPEIVVLSELNNEHGRVEFVRGIVQQLATKSGIRVNPRKLYASDRFAVRELLKIASPIYRGITNTSVISEASSKNAPKAADLKKISTLSNALPKHSVELFDMLDKEVQIRESRTKILSTMPSLDDYGKNVTDAVSNTETRYDTLTKELDRLGSDEEALTAKIKQRKHEYERQSKRLMSVQTIRPAYMDEYEMHEQELQELFKAYFQHYRNIDYFEKELQKHDIKASERSKIESSKWNQRKQKEEMDLIEQVKGSVNPPVDSLQGYNFNTESNDEVDIPADDSSDNGF